MTNTDQTYRLRSYRGGWTNGINWHRSSNGAELDLILDRDQLTERLALLGIQAAAIPAESNQVIWQGREYTWAPVGQCPNEWHRTESAGRDGRCPDCPRLTEHATDGNLTATTVLREVMYRLGLPAREDLSQDAAVAVDSMSHGAYTASVVLRVPGATRYRVTIQEM